MSDGNGKIPSEKGIRRDVGYKRPPAEHRIKPGEVRNPNGRRGAAGTSIAEWWNVMQDWPRVKVEKAANDAKTPAAQRAAAHQWLAAMDGAGKSVDRICDRTVGKPKQAIDVNRRGRVRYTFNIGTAGSGEPSDN